MLASPPARLAAVVQRRNTNQDSKRALRRGRRCVFARQSSGNGEVAAQIPRKREVVLGGKGPSGLNVRRLVDPQHLKPHDFASIIKIIGNRATLDDIARFNGCVLAIFDVRSRDLKIHPHADRTHHWSLRSAFASVITTFVSKLIVTRIRFLFAV